MPRQKTLSTIPAAHSSDGIKTKGHKVTNEVQKIELRIAELEEAKAALLQHAERLEQARDESSTYAVLLNKDSDGLRAFEDLSDELIKVAGKVAAFDKALAAEQANLAEASRLLDLEADREVAFQGREHWANQVTAMTKVEEHLIAAMDNMVVSYAEFTAAQRCGVANPSTDAWRVAMVAVVKKALAKPMVEAAVQDERFGAAMFRQIASEFGVDFTPPSQRRDVSDFLDNWTQSVERQLQHRIEMAHKAEPAAPTETSLERDIRVNKEQQAATAKLFDQHQERQRILAEFAKANDRKPENWAEVHAWWQQTQAA